ncbi:hypothetical protein CEXT_800371 [Caerostris extrusa]|uniref:Uncharacterized protein n=1 Tax=Caerostris extrusa TaxID=172846 RepID=A0AAV4RE88_CAEEX|nr:hypothetical protein CEXT_800371 [Caerostris extrusa]
MRKFCLDHEKLVRCVLWKLGKERCFTCRESEFAPLDVGIVTRSMSVQRTFMDSWENTENSQHASCAHENFMPVKKTPFTSIEPPSTLLFQSRRNSNSNEATKADRDFNPPNQVRDRETILFENEGAPNDDETAAAPLIITTSGLGRY